MPPDKAPGCDGMTAEVLKACLDFMKEDFLEMVHDFWRTGTLACDIKHGVIKFIPNKMDKRRLGDWPPLTLLTIIYKVLAKLLAVRF